MGRLHIPEPYENILGERETEHAIAAIKEFFQGELSTELNLTRVTAPLFVPADSGLNDNLNGVEVPVSFAVKDLGGRKMEIVHSLAKWKRVKVTDMGLAPNFGVYTDMNAIRPDEELDNIHSLYVDQWDWEMAISEDERTVMHLKEVVEKIYRCLKRVEFFVYDRWDRLSPSLPEKITFIHADDLQRKFPDLTAKQREKAVCEQFGAVFVIGIGGSLPDGTIHDGRAPDYDDWITETGDGHRGLNGDLLVWNPVLGDSFELSSMGIRVDPESLRLQLAERGCLDRGRLPFHRRLLDGDLSLTMGGGIGQSRMCMFFLKKAHIGEIQVSMWSDEDRAACARRGINLL